MSKSRGVKNRIIEQKNALRYKWHEGERESKIRVNASKKQEKTSMGKTAKKLEIKERKVYNAEIEKCLFCGEGLRKQRHYKWRKTVQKLDKTVYVANQGSECVNEACEQKGRVYSSAEAQMLTVPNCTYGLDVIAQIGWWRERENLNRKQIHSRLVEKGVKICEREVDILYKQYQVLMGCVERGKMMEVREKAEKRGGMIISLDGLSPEGATEQLWVVREIEGGVILAVGWLPKVNYETLGELFKPIVELEIPILATVSDKQACVRKAVETTFPEVPHQWCQAHYLGNATRPIYDHDSTIKTQMAKTIRKEIAESMKELETGSQEAVFSPSNRNGSGHRDRGC